MNSIRIFKKVVLALILGSISPILGLLIFWWAAFTWLPEHAIPYAVLLGLALGFILDGIFLTRVVRAADQLPLWVWMAVHIFYSAGLFGFFMGVPVFHVLLAIPAGFVIGSRLSAAGVTSAQGRPAALRTAWFTSAVLLIVCISSAVVALQDPYTAGSLEGMLGLGFQVTQGMLLALALVGGLLLLSVNWLLTVSSVRFSYTFMARQ